MKYLIRSIKYFLYLVMLLALMILILVQMKLVDGNLSTMFVNGYDSLWQIALIMAVFAAVYPRLGYSRRPVRMGGETSELRPVVQKVMCAKGYVLSRETGEDMVFVRRSIVERIFRQFEDSVTFSRTAFGYDVEGRAKDVVRIVGSLESEEI